VESHVPLRQNFFQNPANNFNFSIMFPYLNFRTANLGPDLILFLLKPRLHAEY
jgi:hypothetical protein